MCLSTFILFPNKQQKIKIKEAQPPSPSKRTLFGSTTSRLTFMFPTKITTLLFPNKLIHHLRRLNPKAASLASYYSSTASYYSSHLKPKKKKTTNQKTKKNLILFLLLLLLIYRNVDQGFLRSRAPSPIRSVSPRLVSQIQIHFRSKLL